MNATVVLADDHPIVRQGLHALLASVPDFQVVGEASDGLEALELTQRLEPNVLIVDLVMPGLNGLEVTRRVSQAAVPTRVVVLSMHANEAYLLEALRNGAAGYVLKATPGADLIEAVRQVAAGRRYFSPLLPESVLRSSATRAEAIPQDSYGTLTAREREVLRLAAEGYSNPAIAARLCISTRTTETHRAHVLQKLGLHTQTDLVRYALRRGLLPL